MKTLTLLLLFFSINGISQDIPYNHPKNIDEINGKILADGEYIIQDMLMTNTATKDSLEIALGYFDILIGIDNIKDTVIYFERGLIYFYLKRYQEAFDDFNKCIELQDPIKNDVFFRNKPSYLKISTNTYTISYTKFWINLKPNDAYMYRGVCRYNMKQKQLACEDFIIAKELGNDEAPEYITKNCK